MAFRDVALVLNQADAIGWLARARSEPELLDEKIEFATAYASDASVYVVAVHCARREVSSVLSSVDSFET